MVNLQKTQNVPVDPSHRQVVLVFARGFVDETLHCWLCAQVQPDCRQSRAYTREPRKYPDEKDTLKTALVRSHVTEHWRSNTCQHKHYSGDVHTLVVLIINERLLTLNYRTSLTFLLNIRKMSWHTLCVCNVKKKCVFILLNLYNSWGKSKLWK